MLLLNSMAILVVLRARSWENFYCREYLEMDYSRSLTSSTITRIEKTQTKLISNSRPLSLQVSISIPNQEVKKYELDVMHKLFCHLNPNVMKHIFTPCNKLLSSNKNSVMTFHDVIQLGKIHIHFDDSTTKNFMSS